MAAKRFVTFAIAAFAALAALPSARGQIAIGSLGMPTYTLKGAKVGLEPDGSTWQTVLWIINTAAGDWSYTEMCAIDPTTGASIMISTTFASGGPPIQNACWNGGPNDNGAIRYIVTAWHPTDPVQTFSVQLWSAFGYAITAIVQHLDATGNLLSSTAMTDPQLLLPTVTTRFTLGLDTSSGADVIVSNTANVPANVTFAAYDPNPSTTNRTPFATTTVQIPPQGKFCRLVSDIFAGNADYAAGLASPIIGGPNGELLQGVLTVSSDQPISVNAVIVNTRTDGSLISTAWYAFPSVPATATVASVYGFNATTNVWTKGAAVTGTYLILFGAFAASGNGVAIDGTVLPPSALIYQSAGQINVCLGSFPLSAGEHSAIVTALGGASAPTWLAVTSQ
jgi:hypothetical protein